MSWPSDGAWGAWVGCWRGWDAGGVRSLQYERWTLWGWVVRVLLTLLVIGTAIELIGVIVALAVG